MLKYVLMGASSLLSFGFLAHQDEPKQADGEPVAQKQEDGKAEISWVFVDGPEKADPASNLRTAYVLLRQLRDTRLEEKPKALADRAIVLYRDGVKALHSGDVLAAQKLGSASLELAQAVELTRVARASDDGELPAPPVVTFTLADDDKPGEKKAAIVGMPPRINGELVADGANEPKRVVVQGNVQLAPGEGDSPNLYILRSDGNANVGNVYVTQDAKEKREFVIKTPENQNVSRVFTFTPSIKTSNNLKTARVYSYTPNPVASTFQAVDDGAQARQELQAAYEKIRAARAKYKGAEMKVYLDSARDLYNAARKEAEAGRNARSLELTRAAVALVRVPVLLEEGKSAKKTLARELRYERREEKRDEKREANEEKKEEKRYRIHVVPRTDEHGQVELEVTPEGVQAHGEPVQGRVRIETRARVIGPDGKPQDKVKVEEREIAPGEKPEVEARVELKADDAGPVVGVGLMLSVEDDNVIVRGLIPGSPAEKEGSIHEGDRLVGVEHKPGDVVKFEGKDLGEIVKHVRGKPGSHVRLVIVPKDGEESKVVEIVRDTIQVPAQHQEAEEEVKEKEEAKPQAFRLTIPGGRELQGELKLDVHPQAVRLHEQPLRIELRSDEGDGAKPAEEPKKDKKALPPAMDA